MERPLLIVDDDTGVQKLLKTVLECEHFEVMIANDGQEALSHLERTHPALILLDLMMPRMDGPTFVTELEQRGLRASIPVIALTANVYAQSLIERMHVDCYLSKPFHVAELLQQIRQLLDKYRDVVPQITRSLE